MTITLQPTDQPALAPQVISEIEEYWRTNGGCQWPCWWGITPGHSTSNDVIKSLSHLARIVPLSTKEGTRVGLDVKLAALPGNLVDPGVLMRLANDKVTAITICDVGNQAGTEFSELVVNLGLPELVRIQTYSEPLDLGNGASYLPFTVYLYFPESGLAAAYPAEAHVKDGIILGCISSDFRPSMYLWSPENGLLIEDVLAPFGVSLETTQDFGDAVDRPFADVVSEAPVESEVCIQTRADLWPNR